MTVPQPRVDCHLRLGALAQLGVGQFGAQHRLDGHEPALTPNLESLIAADRRRRRPTAHPTWARYLLSKAGGGWAAAAANPWRQWAPASAPASAPAPALPHAHCTLRPDRACAHSPLRSLAAPLGRPPPWPPLAPLRVRAAAVRAQLAHALRGGALVFRAHAAGALAPHVAAQPHAPRQPSVQPQSPCAQPPPAAAPLPLSAPQLRVPPLPSAAARCAPAERPRARPQAAHQLKVLPPQRRIVRSLPLRQLAPPQPPLPLQRGPPRRAAAPWPLARERRPLLPPPLAAFARFPCERPPPRVRDRALAAKYASACSLARRCSPSAADSAGRAALRPVAGVGSEAPPSAAASASKYSRSNECFASWLAASAPSTATPSGGPSADGGAGAASATVSNTVGVPAFAGCAPPSIHAVGRRLAKLLAFRRGEPSGSPAMMRADDGRVRVGEASRAGERGWSGEPDAGGASSACATTKACSRRGCTRSGDEAGSATLAGPVRPSACPNEYELSGGGRLGEMGVEMAATLGGPEDRGRGGEANCAAERGGELGRSGLLGAATGRWRAAAASACTTSAAVAERFCWRSSLLRSLRSASASMCAACVRWISCARSRLRATSATRRDAASLRRASACASARALASSSASRLRSASRRPSACRR
eukprot:scaffold7426_cov27-Tisochrysis_lutea.AAC.1